MIGVCLGALIPPAASTGAERVDRLFLGLGIFCGAVVLVVAALVTWFGIRYRAGSRADRTGRTQVTAVEVSLLSATLLAFLTMCGWAGHEYFVNESAPAGARTVYVVGKQWMWKIEHQGGRREINELHVPVDEDVRLVLTSADVIHSFFVPAFRMKQDALPDRYTSLWFHATRPGVYRLFCAEYCGSEHSRMIGHVVVMPRDEFQRWLGDAPLEKTTPGTPGAPGSPMAAGKELFFRLGCNTCHLPRDAVRAPRLDGIFGRVVKLDTGRLVVADETYIRESILEPNAKITAGYPAPSLMPSFRGQVTEDDIRALIEFIRELQNGWPPDSTGEQSP